MQKRGIRESLGWQAYDRSRYAVLFLVLLLTLFLMPLSVALGLPQWVIKIPVAACVFAAVMPNATPRTRSAMFAALVVLVAAATVAQHRDVPVNNGVGLAVLGLIGLAAAASTMRFMVMAEGVNSEVIYAALSTYLLAGIFFGQFYWAIENLQPGSIVGPDPLTEDRATYFSFVTLATLGYGDYLPRTEIARGLATFEVIGGQLYLAVMVARLISLFAPSEPAR
jgi:hypothetical protein